jgi:hypothetical protein
MPRSAILLVALWLAACGGGGGSGDDTSDSSGAPTSGPMADACAPGWEGCACHEGACIAGLECLSGFCVAVPGGETTEGSDPATTDAPTTVEPDPTSSSSDDAPVQSSSDDDTPIESSSESASDDGPPPECFDGDTWCDEDPDAFDDDVLLTCVDGQWQEQTCTEACAEGGLYLSTPGCETPPDSCRCSGYLDPDCSQGANTYCHCRDLVLGIECDDEYPDYLACFQDELDLSCWAQYESYSVQDCQNAVEACE